VSTTDQELLVEVADRLRHRFYGKYRGIVTDNNDPSNMMRIKATVPAVLGGVETGWAMPCVPYAGDSVGMFFLPDTDAGVWIEFEGGDLSYPIWTGTWYTTGAIPESATPSKKVLKTTSGHKIVLDDDGGSVEVTDSNGNTISMDASVIKIQTSAATQVVIDGPQIQLVQDSEHPLVFGDNLLEYLNQLVELYQTHMHPGELALGVFPVTPAPPVPPFPPATPELISTRVTTG
jgi:phage baseplate assembly protein gpV